MVVDIRVIVVVVIARDSGGNSSTIGGLEAVHLLLERVVRLGVSAAAAAVEAGGRPLLGPELVLAHLHHRRQLLLICCGAAAASEPAHERRRYRLAAAASSVVLRVHRLSVQSLLLAVVHPEQPDAA